LKTYSILNLVDNRVKAAIRGYRKSAESRLDSLEKSIDQKLDGQGSSLSRSKALVDTSSINPLEEDDIIEIVKN